MITCKDVLTEYHNLLWNLLAKYLISARDTDCFQAHLNKLSLLTRHTEWGSLRNGRFYGKGQLKFMHALWVIVYRLQLIHQALRISLSFIMRGWNKSMHIYRTYVTGAGLGSINELREWGFITVEMSSALLCKCPRNTNARPVHHREGHLKKLSPQTQMWPNGWPIHFRNHNLFSIKPLQRSDMWHSLCQGISIEFPVDIRPQR